MEATVYQTIRRRYNPAPLRDALDALGLTQQALAAETDCPWHFTTLNYALRGNPKRRISGEVVTWLCKRLDVPEALVYGGLA